jgi:hypothetical protein
MNDSLKNFVDQNRDRFDTRQLPPSVWGKIEAALPTKSVSLWNSLVVWRAAAALLLGVSSFLLVSREDAKTNKAERAKLKIEFVDLESYYGDQILEKKQLVSHFQSETGLTEDEVTQNLQKLEAMYQVLRLEMDMRPSEDVKNALVLNLLVRIDLLNQHLNKLDKPPVKIGAVSS